MDTQITFMFISIATYATTSKVVQLIKGESAFWINKNNLTPENFQWQNEYFAISISKVHFERVFNYVRNQEEHHATRSFSKEYSFLLKKHGLQIVDES